MSDPALPLPKRWEPPRERLGAKKNCCRQTSSKEMKAACFWGHQNESFKIACCALEVDLQPTASRQALPARV